MRGDGSCCWEESASGKDHIKMKSSDVLDRSPVGHPCDINSATRWCHWRTWSSWLKVMFLTSLVILMRSVAVSEYLPWLFRISALSKAQRSASTMFLPGNKGDIRSDSIFMELEKAPTHTHTQTSGNEAGNLQHSSCWSLSSTAVDQLTSTEGRLLGGSDWSRTGEKLLVPAGVPVGLDGRVHVVGWIWSGSSSLQESCYRCHFLESTAEQSMDGWRRLLGWGQPPPTWTFYCVGSEFQIILECVDQSWAN